MKRLFGAAKPRDAGPLSQMHSQLAMSQTATRREALRLALRDTLQRYGMPAEWISSETLTLTSRSGERNVHWRLVVKHWDPRILTHGVALQQALVRRVTAFDPLAPDWLQGISWQFALEDESVCPAMPHPASWTAQSQATAHEETAPAPLPEAEPEADPHADLQRLFAIRDADFQQHAGGEPSPAWSRTEPAKL